MRKMFINQYSKDDLLFFTDNLKIETIVDYFKFLNYYINKSSYRTIENIINKSTYPNFKNIREKNEISVFNFYQELLINEFKNKKIIFINRHENDFNNEKSLLYHFMNDVGISNEIKFKYVNELLLILKSILYNFRNKYFQKSDKSPIGIIMRGEHPRNFTGYYFNENNPQSKKVLYLFYLYIFYNEFLQAFLPIVKDYVCESNYVFFYNESNFITDCYIKGNELLSIQGSNKKHDFNKLDFASNIFISKKAEEFFFFILRSLEYIDDNNNLIKSRGLQATLDSIINNYKVKNCLINKEGFLLKDFINFVNSNIKSTEVILKNDNKLSAHSDKSLNKVLNILNNNLQEFKE
ncbi:hypothetical protein [Faecalibacter bovis]|uniref:Uncharacterized protein n=1 Tax=Faecalibacter bovis TaxID=2898187 RepID=A0ABX7XAD6_9FLAO|nr:hypothetical protein [Faecalibacter bovis]QTV04852.1 hypothetical protein J9309_08580 [Faecalibacter bovis]